jgi:hypothetical protein
MLCEMGKIFVYYKQKKPVAFLRVSWKYDRFKIKHKTQVIETNYF